MSPRTKASRIYKDYMKARGVLEKSVSFTVDERAVKAALALQDTFERMEAQCREATRTADTEAEWKRRRERVEAMYEEELTKRGAEFKDAADKLTEENESD